MRKRTFDAPPSERQQNERFWAHIRTLSEKLGYTDRVNGGVATHGVDAIVRSLRSLGLKSDHVADARGAPTTFGRDIIGYFEMRSRLLNAVVEPALMDADAAKSLFIQVFREVRPDPLSLPWNKQSGSKMAPAYLTGIVNMVLSRSLCGAQCDFNPHTLTTVTIGGEPFRTLARRVDGAFPGAVNPIAVWEIKEYYYTTTFGSRVADGIYETLLDGLELDGLEATSHGRVDHYLVIDARHTWWGQGNPYLCRLIDMLHMGYIDELVVGSEVVDAMSRASTKWMRALAERNARRGGDSGILEVAASQGLGPGRAELASRTRRWNEWARRNGLSKFCI